MPVDVNNLFKRLQTLEAEATYERRKLQEEAEKAERALASLSQSDIDLIKEYIPAIEEVSKYTAADLVKNANGELSKLSETYSELTMLLDKWLLHYEGGLS